MGCVDIFLVHMDCSVVAMALKASMVVLQWCFLLNNTWLVDAFGGLGFYLNDGFLGYIFCHNFFGYVVYSLACRF